MRNPLLLRVSMLAVALGVGCMSAPATRAGSEPGAIEVRVERVKPKREKYPTLRFLKANRDFIRGRYDRLSEKVVQTKGEAEPIDPRFLAYREMLARIAAGRDSIRRVEDLRQREQLLASVTELGQLESQLDVMETELSEQQTRLATIEHDFAGDQRTALMVVLSGYPSDATLTQVAIALEDGAVFNVPLSEDQRATLRHGGVVQVFHGLVEPRDQVLTVSVSGDRWPAGDAGYVQLDPERDRLTLLKLDLSTLHAAQGASSIQASTWLHDSGTPPIGG